MTYIKRKSKKQEERTSKDFRGKTQIASGALYFAKADVKTGGVVAGKFNEDDFLIENKFTDADRYKFEFPLWDKIEKEAMGENFRTPLMQIDVQDLELVVMDAETYFTDERLPKLETLVIDIAGKSKTLSLDFLRKEVTYSKAVVLTFSKHKKSLYVVLKDLFILNKY